MSKTVPVDCAETGNHTGVCLGGDGSPVVKPGLKPRAPGSKSSAVCHRLPKMVGLFYG